MIDTTQTDGNPGLPQETDPQRPAPVGHTQDSVTTTLDMNPTLSAEIRAALQEGGVDSSTDNVQVPPKAGVLASIWDTVKKSFHGAERGAAEAVNNASNTAMDLGKNLAKAAHDAGADEMRPISPEAKAKREQSFMEWYSGRTAEQNPIQIPEDKINKWFGAAQGGLPGFVEGVSQFVTGLALTHKVAVPGGTAVKAALKGAVADIAAFDPYQKRLSNMIQNGPTWMRNPLTEFLASKDDDPMPLARFKQAAEGIILNSTIEGLTHGVKALKASAKGDTEAASKSIADAVAAHETPVVDEPAKIVKAEDGKWAVVENVEKSQDVPTGTFTQGEAESHAASINWIAQNRKYIPGELDGESLAAFRERMKAYTDGSDKRSIEDLRDQYGINMNYVQSPEEVVNTIKSMVDVMPDPSEMTRNRPRTFEEMRDAAGSLFKDMPADEVLANAQRVFNDTERLPEHVLAMREWMQGQADHTAKLSQMVEANPDNAGAVEELGRALDTMLEFHAHLTGTSSNVARSLAIHRMPVGEAAQELATAGAEGGAKETPEGLAADADGVGGTVTNEGSAPHRAPSSGPKATEGLTRMQIRALARSIFLKGNEDPAAILALVRAPKVTPKVVQALPPTTLQKYTSFLQTLRMEAMLSGPKTQVTKVASDFMTMMQRPAEYWWAGVRSSNPALRDMGTNMYGAIFANLKDSFSAARMAFKNGDNVLLPSNSHTGTTLGPLSQNSWLTNIGHLPSRLLMTTDEFAKQMNYRMNMRAQILRNAEAMGVSDPKELAQRLVDDMQFAFDPDGGAVNPLALQYAKENTFTNELRPGSIQQKVLDAVNQHPSLKVIMPFVRTPMNIFNFAWERTPLLNKLNKDMQDAWSGKYGPEAKALAQAKNDFGTAVYSAAALLTYSGHITGRGPSNAELRKQWVAAGNQPYSLRIPGTDNWISYRRANPTLDALGLVADAVQVSSELPEDSFMDVATAVAASIASNATSKTFMQGISEFTDAMGEGSADKMNKFFKSMAGSFVPNAANQLNPDHTLRETRTMLDEVMGRLPGFSETLEPRRNLLGEPIMRPPGYFNGAVNPFTIAPGVKPDNVQNELVKLGKAFQMPAEKRVGGLIDLTDRDTFGKDRDGQSPYDRMLEIMASPPNNAPSLREKLTDLVNTPQYEKVPGEDAYGPGGMKWKLANDIIQSYQSMAWGQVLKEYPTLKAAFQQAMDMKAQGMAHGQEGVNDVMQKYETMFLTKKQ